MRIAISWRMSNVECRTQHIFYLTCHNRLWNIIFHKNQSNIAIPYTQQTSLKKQILYAIQYACMKNVAASFFRAFPEKPSNCTTSNWHQGLPPNVFCTSLLIRTDYRFPVQHVQRPETSSPSPQCPGRLYRITASNTKDLSSVFHAYMKNVAASFFSCLSERLHCMMSPWSQTKAGRTPYTQSATHAIQCLTTIAEAYRSRWKSQSTLFCTEYGNGCSKRRVPTTQIQTSSIASQKVTLYDVTLITNKGWPHPLHSISHTCYTMSSYHSWSIPNLHFSVQDTGMDVPSAGSSAGFRPPRFRHHLLHLKRLHCMMSPWSQTKAGRTPYTQSPTHPIQGLTTMAKHSKSAFFCTGYGNGCSKRRVPLTQIQTSSIASQKVTLYDVTLITNKGWPHPLHSITHMLYKVLLTIAEEYRSHWK